ncbi:Uncharacterized protein Rs2_24837 [Raphanus sativus]|nr:Uncharacterized protein Rs2_24837 [Raphanus sativus]
MTQCLNSSELGSRLQALCSHAASESSLAPSFSSLRVTNAAFIGVNIGTDLTNMPSPSDIAIEHMCIYGKLKRNRRKLSSHCVRTCESIRRERKRDAHLHLPSSLHGTNHFFVLVDEDDKTC